MSDVFDRLEKGPQGQTGEKYNDWNEMVGASPTDRTPSSYTPTQEPLATPSSAAQNARGMAGDMINRFIQNKPLMIGTALAGAAFLARRSRQQKQQG